MAAYQNYLNSGLSNAMSFQDWLRDAQIGSGNHMINRSVPVGLRGPAIEANTLLQDPNYYGGDQGFFSPQDRVQGNAASTAYANNDPYSAMGGGSNLTSMLQQMLTRMGGLGGMANLQQQMQTSKNTARPAQPYQYQPYTGPELLGYAGGSPDFDETGRNLPTYGPLSYKLPSSLLNSYNTFSSKDQNKFGNDFDDQDFYRNQQRAYPTANNNWSNQPTQNTRVGYGGSNGYSLTGGGAPKTYSSTTPSYRAYSGWSNAGTDTPNSMQFRKLGMFY